MWVTCLTILVAAGQAASQSACPSIRITGPSGILNPGDLAMFSAGVDGVDMTSLRFHWSVTDGTVEEGSGTSSVQVRAPKSLEVGTVRVSLKVDGLPTSCPSESESFAPYGPTCILPLLLNEYGRIPIKWELAQLDLVAHELDPSINILVFVLFSDQDEQKAKVDTRIARIRNHLVRVRKVPPSGIVFLFGGNLGNRTAIYRVPKENAETLMEGLGAKIP